VIWKNISIDIILPLIIYQVQVRVAKIRHMSHDTDTSDVSSNDNIFLELNYISHLIFI